MSDTRNKRGRMVIYCPKCRHYFVTTEKKFDHICPKCRSYVFRMRCFRCGHEWTPRDPMVMPDTCPKCKSPYWNRERIR